MKLQILALVLAFVGSVSFAQKSEMARESDMINDWRAERAAGAPQLFNSNAKQLEECGLRWVSLTDYPYSAEDAYKREIKRGKGITFVINEKEVVSAVNGKFYEGTSKKQIDDMTKINKIAERFDSNTKDIFLNLKSKMKLSDNVLTKRALYSINKTLCLCESYGIAAAAAQLSREALLKDKLLRVKEDNGDRRSLKQDDLTCPR